MHFWGSLSLSLCVRATQSGRRLKLKGTHIAANARHLLWTLRRNQCFGQVYCLLQGGRQQLGCWCWWKTTGLSSDEKSIKTMSIRTMFLATNTNTCLGCDLITFVLTARFHFSMKMCAFYVGIQKCYSHQG